MPGPQEFMDGLARMGLEVEVCGGLVLVTLKGGVDHGGTCAIKLGADPPADFPRVPPHWLHLPESIEVPGGGRQPSELGEGWSKWSRPHPKWTGGDGASQAWLAHARSLIAEFPGAA